MKRALGPWPVTTPSCSEPICIIEAILLDQTLDLNDHIIPALLIQSYDMIVFFYLEPGNDSARIILKSIKVSHYYKSYNYLRFYRMFNGGFQTATTQVTVEIAIITVSYGTASVNSFSLAVVLKNLHYKWYLYLRFAA